MSWFISLHSADPTGGNQATDEVAYGSYARIEMVDWIEVGENLTNAADALFPVRTDGDVTATHVGLGTDATGEGTLLGSGALVEPVAISTGIQPCFKAGGLVVAVDASSVITAALAYLRHRSTFLYQPDYYDVSQGYGEFIAPAASCIGVELVEEALVRPPLKPPIEVPGEQIGGSTEWAMFYGHHGELSGSGYTDSTERLAAEDEEQAVILLLMAA